MKFDSLISVYIKEDEDNSEHVFVTGGKVGIFGIDNTMNNIKVSGSVASVMIEVMEHTLKQYRDPATSDELQKANPNYSTLFTDAHLWTPGKIEDCDHLDIKVDDPISPSVCSVLFSWYIDDNFLNSISFYFCGVDSRLSVSGLPAEWGSEKITKDWWNGKGNSHSITIDQLKEIKIRSLVKRSIKGHDLEDLINF